MRNFGLIGFPLSHSFSKRYFSDKFQTEQIAGCTYENYQLPSIDLFPGFVRGIDGLEGLNVTIPYKEAIIPLLDKLDVAAQRIGAVNTILFRGGTTTGYNTDVIGFERSLIPLLKNYHEKALILGTGGASKAIAFALRQLGIAFQFVSRGKRSEDCIGYDDLDQEVIREHTLLVNTTPVGTSPDVDDAPSLPYQFVGEKHLLYDLVYNPPETLFLRKGRMQGAQIKNGYEMLVLQAEASWEIWNG